MTSTPPTPGDKFAGFTRFLNDAVVTRYFGGLISSIILILVGDRLRQIKWRFDRLAELIRSGKGTKRRSPEPRGSDQISPAFGKPRPPSKLPRERGWLARLLPEPAQQRGYLSGILQEPEMEAMLKQAPPTMIRSIRSICWSLGLPANEIPALKLPERPRPRKPEPPAAPEPAAPEPAATDPAAPAASEPAPAPISWKKPRGSISNRLYRNYKPPGSRPKRKKA